MNIEDNVLRIVVLAIVVSATFALGLGQTQSASGQRYSLEIENYTLGNPTVRAGEVDQTIGRFNISSGDDQVVIELTNFSLLGKVSSVKNITVRTEKEHVVAGPFDLSSRGDKRINDKIAVPVRANTSYIVKGTIDPEAEEGDWTQLQIRLLRFVESGTGQDLTYRQPYRSRSVLLDKIRVVDPSSAEKGTINITPWQAVTDQNIVESVGGQPLAAYSVEVSGEPVSVREMKFDVLARSRFADGRNITNITIEDEDATVLAGPVDGSKRNIRISDEIIFPVGVTNIVLLGKLGTDFVDGDTIRVTTRPRSDWKRVRGVNTKERMNLSFQRIVGRTMTVRSGALAVSVSVHPASQSFPAGSSQFEFARYVFDATQSSEDIHVTSIPLMYSSSGNPTDLSNCKLYDGTTAANGSNPLNPTGIGSALVLLFDGTGLRVDTGTVKTLSFRCDVNPLSTGIYRWGLDGDHADSFSGATGVNSGQTVDVVFTGSDGQAMTSVSGGTLSASLSPNSPAYRIVHAGAVDVELSRIEFSATTEDIDLRQVSLQLSGTSQNSPSDLVNREVRLYSVDDLENPVANALFVADDHATSSAITNFLIPRNTSKVLVVKGNLSDISVVGPVNHSGDLLRVDYDGDNNGLNGNYGIGLDSGSVRVPSSPDTSSRGVRIMNSYPRVESVPLSASERLLSPGFDRTLYKFKVSAVGDDIALYKFTINAAAQNAELTSVNMYAYSDSGFSNPLSSFSPTGALSSQDVVVGSPSGGNVDFRINRSNGIPSVLVIPAGATRFFEVVASLAEAGVPSTVTSSVLGDAAYPLGSSLMSSAAAVDADSNDNFIWSPISTVFQINVDDPDFTNGFAVPGLPSTNMPIEVLSR